MFIFGVVGVYGLLYTPSKIVISSRILGAFTRKDTHSVGALLLRTEVIDFTRKLSVTRDFYYLRVLLFLFSIYI